MKLRIGTPSDQLLAPKTWGGVAGFSGLALATAAVTASPIAVVGVAGAAWLAKLWRSRDDRDGYLFESDLDALAEDDHQAVSSEVMDVLAAYGLQDAREVDQLHGHVLTRHLISIPRGTKLGTLPDDDIARDLGIRAVTIHKNAGRAMIGLDVPRPDRQTVGFAELMAHPQWVNRAEMSLPVCPGVDVIGNPVVFDLQAAPHLIVGGTTGQGKSVFMNALILSLMASGADFRLMLGDGKGEDFAPFYANSKHLLRSNGVNAIETEVEGITQQIEWLAAEMDNRFKTGVKPYPIVFVIDELADIAMQAKGSDLINSLTRIAQKGRAAKIHLVIGTQYPSADVLPPLLRANIPSRAGLTVAKDYESRVVLGEVGCEKLLGRGDCLLKLVGGNPERMHGAMITESDLSRYVA